MNLFENQKLNFPTEKKYIKDLKTVGEKVDGFYKIASAQKRIKKDGGSFLTLELMDRTGKIPAKVWNNADPFFKKIEEGKVFKIVGSVNEYMNKREIKVDTLKLAVDGDYEPDDFMEEAGFDTEATFKEMMEFVKTHVTDPHLLQLADLFANKYGERFRIHYGAQKVHHAYLGGLMEHTFSIMKLAVMCADHYKLDKDLLVVGALFHDIGKMFEFRISPIIETTMAGGLLGHITIGVNMFHDLKKQIPDFPRDLAYKIQHLMISHHGEKEYGSPEIPKTSEAFVLHILDLLDSRLQIVDEALEASEAKGQFTDYIHVLSRRLYLPPERKEE